MSPTLELDWNAFFARYRAVAVRFARGLARDAALAEDLFQEAARAVYEREKTGTVRFESEAHARNYFFRALRNLAVDSLQDPARKRAAPFDPETAVPAKDPSALEAAGASDLDLERARRDRTLDAAVRSLRPDERAALQLRFAEGLSFREMAERTGTSISTLQARVESALGKIRKKIGKEFREA